MSRSARRCTTRALVEAYYKDDRAMPEALIERARIAVDELRRVDRPLDPESVARSMDLRTMPEFIEVVRWANEIAAAKVLRED
jgi:hypothetical protein